MLDTTPEMQEKQLEIFFSKSAEEQVKMGLEMTDFAYQVVRNSVVAQHPDVTEREIAVEIFRRYYENDFSKKQLDIIIKAILSA